MTLLRSVRRIELSPRIAERMRARLALMLVGEEAVWLLMRKAGLQGPARLCRVANQLIAGDLVDRNFVGSDLVRVICPEVPAHEVVMYGCPGERHLRRRDLPKLDHQPLSRPIRHTVRSQML